MGALYILDKKGNTLIARHYRADLPGDLVERYHRAAHALPEGARPPTLVDDGVVFTALPHRNVVLLVAGAAGGNALAVLAFLRALVALMRSYFKEVEEESVKDNFVLVYELLDEGVDNGHVQCLDPAVLKQYVKADYHELVRRKRARPRVYAGPRPAGRAPGVVHSPNECFVDVVERADYTLSAAGAVLRAEIRGAVRCRPRLSGQPVVELELNALGGEEAAEGETGVEFSDVKLHACVDLDAYAQSRRVIFSPPDEEFELLSYSVAGPRRPLFLLQLAATACTATRREFALKLSAAFNSTMWAVNVRVLVPLPCDALTPKAQTAVGSTRYLPDKERLSWKIPVCAGEESHCMEFGYALPSLASPDREAFAAAPVTIEFEVPYFTLSGLVVQAVRVSEAAGYATSPWVKYLTCAGVYEVRV